MKIGIAITTRNRNEILKISLNHFINYKASSNLISEIYLYVYSDEGESLNFMYDFNLRSHFKKVKFIRGDKRIGISGSKNECIKALKDFECDYFFLWDDDLFPKKKYWADIFINSSIENNVNHLMYLIQVGDIKLLERKNNIEIYNNCGGGMLFFTKHAINTIGGYRKFPQPYGLEHGEITHRIHRSGLQNGFPQYISPANCRDYIYSLDFDLNWFNIPPPLNPKFKQTEFYSSMRGEDVSPMIEKNNSIFTDENLKNKIYESI